MEQRSKEWFEARKGLITASGVGAILGHSPHATREGVMRRMVREWHGAEPEFTGNVATEYGTRNEPGALVEYQMETGQTVDPGGFFVRDGWAGCSPDGLIGDRGGLEIKCPFRMRAAGPGDQFLSLQDQPHYYDQVQFSLWVTGRAWWHFYQWAPGLTLLSVVKPDYEWQEENIPRLLAFRAEYLDQRETNAGEHLAPPRPVFYTLEAQRMVAEWDELTDAIERATTRKKELLARMVETAGHRDANFAGRRLTLTRKDGPISYAKAVKALAPDADLEQWRGKPVEYWTLR